MQDMNSNSLKIIAEYGQEYGKEKPIRVMYDGYGHYDVLKCSTWSNTAVYCNLVIICIITWLCVSMWLWRPSTKPNSEFMIRRKLFY